ncbi:hypothetical protein [Streptomyces sp. NBC_00690]|uniref:hypothetical protein n=1 Tax=Streptomyces sp. NBC_00690 TaxID=2975808 RepID=UPI002E2953FC|nr:hypothetical protein [Streptomyces sp. NBC_00690]
MHNSKIAFGLIAACLLTVGCGSSDDQDSAGGAAQKALPVAVDGPQKGVIPQREAGEKLKITPLPPMNAPFAEKVEHNLRQDILRSARVPGETSAECPDGVDETAGAVSQCVAVYEGVAIPYEVKISESAKEGSSLIFFTTTPKKGLLVASTAYDSLNEQYGPTSGRTDASKLACQTLPPAKAVPLGKDTGYTCQYWGKHANQGEPGYATLRLTMGPQGSGLGFETIA